MPSPSHTATLEVDLSRFVSGQTYVLNRTITNGKVDKRLKHGGRELRAHREFPQGTRFVLDIIETRERPLGAAEDGVDIIQIVRKYIWSATDLRFFRIEAYDVRGVVVTDGVEKETKHFSYALPHADYSAAHHQVVLDMIASMVPEAVSLESLEARADGVYKTGWEVIADLVRRGIVTLANVQSTVDAFVEEEQAARHERIRAREKGIEGT